MDGLGYSLGFDFSSSTAQSDPFLNNAGITFGDSGGISDSGNPTAQATTAPSGTRQQQGGIAPVQGPDVPVDFSLPEVGANSLPYLVVGGLIALLAAVYFLVKR